MDRSIRVLQRQLKDEGCTFKELLNSVKRDLAIKYLKSSSQKIIDIGESLGYSSHASFTRWFCNEFGLPPSRSRKARSAHDHSTVIFRQKNGEVWAARPDGRPLANLGSHEAVIAMMLDYIRQTDVAERLAKEA
jgi:hypothetical protein